MQPVVARVRNARAATVPEAVRQSLLGAWNAIWWGKGEEQPVIIRNEWHERQLLVSRVRHEMGHLLPDAIRAVRRANGTPALLEVLKNDDILDNEIVDAAVAQLTSALPASTPVTAGAEPGGVPPLMNGRQAADVIGVSEGTVSRWHAAVPAWAKNNSALFLHLLDREDGRYHRHNVRKLKKWYEAAQNSGEQKPVDCP